MNESIDVKEKGINGFQLKIIGAILMVFDHIHQMFVGMGAPKFLNALGRPVAPIFLFMVSEGFHYTRNRGKYLFRLWLAYVLMGISSMVIQRTFPSEIVLMNSIFGTMCLSVFYMWMIDNIINGIKSREIKRVVLSVIAIILSIASSYILILLLSVNTTIAMVFTFLFPSPFLVEGGIVWIIMAVAFYLLRSKGRVAQMLPIVVISIMLITKGDYLQSLMIFAIIPLLLYNGKLGKKSKYFFYIFYPAHIYALYLLAYFIQ
ncbi:MAG: hypothetical protein GXZ08_04110 [Tissierellia bacterium]|nr:hypothetical protein [Tissierellia bacterium]